MSKLLIVTTFRSGDIPLLKKRIEYLNHIQFKPTHDILLIGDYTVDQKQLDEMESIHKPYFNKIITRKFNETPVKNEWPYNVNLAWRVTIKTIFGQYGLALDTTGYVAWFYFETDITVINKDAFSILENNYILLRKSIMGRVNETRASDNRVVRHINGAAIYPIAMDNSLNPKCFIVENIPWDVAGFQVPNPNIGEIPDSAYAMGFNTTEYRRDGSLLIAKQTIANVESTYSFKLDQQLLHHGCKDGSLADCLTIKENKIKVETQTGAINDDLIRDYKNKVPYRQLLQKYKTSPKKITEILKQAGLK